MTETEYSTVHARMSQRLPARLCTRRHVAALGTKLAELALWRGIEARKQLEDGFEVNAWPVDYIDEAIDALVPDAPNTTDVCPYCDAVETTKIGKGDAADRMLCEVCGREFAKGSEK